MGRKAVTDIDFAEIERMFIGELTDEQRAAMEKTAKDAREYMNRRYEDYFDNIIKKNMQGIASEAFTGGTAQQSRPAYDKPFTAEDMNRAYESLFASQSGRQSGKTEKQRAFMEMYGGPIFRGDYDAKYTGDVINGSCAGEYWSKDVPRWEVAAMPTLTPYPIDGQAVADGPLNLDREVYVYADGIWMLESTPEDDVEDIADDLA